MDRAKNIKDREKAPRVDKAASKRFVKSALWKAAQKQQNPAESEGESTPGPSQNVEEGKLRTGQDLK